MSEHGPRHPQRLDLLHSKDLFKNQPILRGSGLVRPRAIGAADSSGDVSMFTSLKQNIQDAFFRSLEQAGCVSLDTFGPDSSDEEEEELGEGKNQGRGYSSSDRFVIDMSGGESSPGEVEPPKRLVGFANFLRHNPKSDRFPVEKFHHIEFWCGDATNTASRFSWGLGMPLVAKSDLSTGNPRYCSQVLRSNDLVFTFTAPYSPQAEQIQQREAATAAGTEDTTSPSSRIPLPYFDTQEAFSFFQIHGLAVRAVAVQVRNVREAYEKSVANGAHGVVPPTTLVDHQGAGGKGGAEVAEVKLYGDVVLRYVSTEEAYAGPFLPNYAPASNQVSGYGLTRLDHAVGNVPKLLEAVDHIIRFSGFHEFAEFTAADVGTVESGLNSMVLANNSENILLPINEPTFGTKRKSQIQTYLEHNEGAGLQHLALMCTDIISTLQEMRARSDLGGFEFMAAPGKEYYDELPARIGAGTLSELQLKQCAELGVLVDRDDQGVLLQIFTRPVGDRPTIFLEIIQRVGCMERGPDGKEYQRGGCGGFGKGNFRELFKSIEDYERLLDGAGERL